MRNFFTKKVRRVTKELKFAPRVAQMCAITFGVALISFLIGFLVKKYFGLEI